MRYTIEQIGDHEWALVASDGKTVATFTDSTTPGGLTGYDFALIALSSLIRESLRADAGEGDGMLPEAWVSDKGIAFSERLDGGRDFTMTKWMWRDPAKMTVPLMLMTKTDVGHFGAELAGFSTEIANTDGVISSAGRFYDQPIGVQARDMLLNGNTFGVSVDPGEATEVEEDFLCDEFDDEGFCVAGTYSLNFLVYEIIGMTMTPMQGFPNAGIKLADSVQASARGAIVVHEAERVLQASGERIEVPARPSSALMLLAEPELGQPFLNRTGDDVLIDQGDNSLAVPVEIEPPYVYGHIARWGACHTGDPWGPGVCAGPEPSMSAYAHFHTGHVVCDDGTDVPTGVLTVGAEHAPEDMSPYMAQDYYANAANGWADVHVVDGQYGIWMSGVLRPDLTDMDLRVLRALSLSGDWRGLGGHLEMVGALSCNGPGLPIKRAALAASAFAAMTIARPSLRASSINGERKLLIAAGMVARCPDCQRRRAEAAAGTLMEFQPDKRIDALLALAEKIERRTRHLAVAESEYQLHASALHNGGA